MVGREPGALVCGVYYPVSILPEPLQAVAAAIPLTHFLEAFRRLRLPPVLPPLGAWLPLALAYWSGLRVLRAGRSPARRTGMLLKLSD